MRILICTKKILRTCDLILVFQENLERKKAEYVEKMKNKIAIIHKEAEEKRAMIEARRGEDLLKEEEMAAKYRATGSAPKKLLGCFWCSNSQVLIEYLFVYFLLCFSIDF